MAYYTSEKTIHVSDNRLIMNVQHPIAERIMRQIDADAGGIVAIADLDTLGSRAALDQALSRLVKQGKVQRVGRGLYAKPTISGLLGMAVTPPSDAMIQAWARKNHLRVVPSEASAANLLGVSTQVPAKLVYYTNGRTRTVRIGPYSVRLLNRGPGTMDVHGGVSPLIIQALRYIGRRGLSEEVVDRLRDKLAQRDKAALRRTARTAVAWMRPVLERLAGKEER